MRKWLVGAACGLSLAAFASPSFALDALMMPNSQAAGMSATQNALTSSPSDKKDKMDSFHFSVRGNSGSYTTFGPNSDRANPLGPSPSYGPPASDRDPFFHN